MEDTIIMRTWWDEKVNLGLKMLSNRGWKNEKPSFYYALL